MFITKYRDAQLGLSDAAFAVSAGAPLIKKQSSEWLPSLKSAGSRDRVFGYMDLIALGTANAFRHFGGNRAIQERTARELSKMKFETFAANLNKGCTVFVVTANRTGMLTPQFLAKMQAENPAAVAMGLAAIGIQSCAENLEKRLDALRDQKKQAIDAQFMEVSE